MTDTVSIIIPVYNVKKYIHDCLTSITNQSYDKLDIILIDDGSTDGSAEECDKWASGDARIQVVHQENKGVSAARNAGLAIAKGELITFADADDWLDLKMIEKLVNRIKQHNADMAVCGFINYSLRINNIGGCIAVEDCGFDEASYYMLKRLTAVWGTIYRREVIYFDDSFIRMPENIAFGEDEVWLFGVMPHCKKITFLPEALYHWRKREGSMTKLRCISENTLTLIEAKKKALILLPPQGKVQTFAKALAYYSLFTLKVLAYCEENTEAFLTLNMAIDEMKLNLYWKRSKEISLLMKAKNRILTALLQVRANRRLVAFLYDIH